MAAALRRIATVCGVESPHAGRLAFGLGSACCKSGRADQPLASERGAVSAAWAVPRSKKVVRVRNLACARWLIGEVHVIVWSRWCDISWSVRVGTGRWQRGAAAQLGCPAGD
jgi:hypothetical protein